MTLNRVKVLDDGVREAASPSLGVTKPHVAVFFARVGPYHFARLKAAAVRMKVTAVESSDVDSTYAWDLVTGRGGFERETLWSGISTASLSGARICEIVDRVLKKLNPAAVAIPGWIDRCGLAALKWCARYAVPAVVMSESNASDEARKPWREIVKKRMVRLCGAGLAGGKTHADYLAQLGMARDRVFLGYDAVDNDYFAEKAHEFRSQKSKVRSQFALPERYFLASARFIEKKNLPRLIQAYARYRQLAAAAETGKRKTGSWNLVLLGDGPLKSDLWRLISDLGLQNSVLLPGFMQYGELPAFYALAGAFIHASTTEQWGLVVNEAMASGLPVLVSNRCGCATDLVREDYNGFTFDPMDAEQLAQLMLRVSDFAFELSAFGDASRKIIAYWGPERFAAGLQGAIELAIKNQGRRAGVLDSLLLKGLIYR